MIDIRGDEQKFHPHLLLETTGKGPLHYYTGKENGKLMSVDTTLTTAFMVLVSVVGTAGNLLVILAILYKRRLRNIPNYFILGLALSDLLTDSLAVPLRLVEGFQPGWIPCNVVIAVTVLFDGLSRINIIFISIDKLIAVKFPFMYSAYMTRATVSILIPTAWIAMAVFAILPVLGVGIAPAEVLRQNQGLCFFSTNLSTSYLLVFLIGFCLMPLILATLINCILLKASHRQMREIHVQQLQLESTTNRLSQDYSANSLSANQPNVQQLNRTFALKQRRVLRMVVVLLGLFTILVVPITVIDLISVFGVSNVPPLIAKIAVCMIYTNATINVFVYAGFNREFRRTFGEIFKATRDRFPILVPCL